MSQLNVVKNSVSADQIYYDITVTNTQSTTTNPPIFYYNESRTIPFINCPQDYYLSILRFTIDTGTLPVFIPTIKANQANVNDTIYSVTLSFNSPTVGPTFGIFESQIFITWVPQDTNAIVPSPPNITSNKQQDNSTGYYNCYSYSYWTALVYKAYFDAFTALQLHFAGDPAFIAVYPPIINWDTTNGQGVMYAEVLGYNYNPLYPILPNPYLNPIKIFMNAPLYSLYGSFPARYLGYEGVTGGKNFQIEVVDIGGTNYQPITIPNTTPAVTYDAIVMYQEYSTISNWTPIVAMVFVSNTLPVTPNQVSTPLIFNENSQIVLGGNNANTANIVTDLVSNNGLYKSSLVYEPISQYRLVTLNGNRPLFNLDLQVFWRDRFGGLNPVTIPSGGSVTMKVGFLKRGSGGM
jgi:hypothetical protein